MKLLKLEVQAVLTAKHITLSWLSLSSVDALKHEVKTCELYYTFHIVDSPFLVEIFLISNLVIPHSQVKWPSRQCSYMHEHTKSSLCQMVVMPNGPVVGYTEWLSCQMTLSQSDIMSAYMVFFS